MLTLILSILLIISNQDYSKMRSEMVFEQIIARGVTDPLVINAMQKVPRHKFVPLDIQSRAYQDCPLPIGFQQTISQPYIVAYMTEQLQLSKGDKILEIGTGSGYQTAVLAEISDQIYTIEIIKPLGLAAKSTLIAEGYSSVRFKIGDGYHGWAKYAPYDAIIVTASPNEVPKELIEQLADNGKLIIPVDDTSQQYLILYTKTKEKIKKRKLIPVRFVPFIRDNN